MSRVAIGNWQLAISEDVPSRWLNSFNPREKAMPISLIANCQLPIAGSYLATCCTVTSPLTSVTQLGLARSVLIKVGKPDLEGLSRLSAPWMLASEALHCSFGDNTCIQ